MPENNIQIPKHIGYIIDGNRRWAKQHGLPVYEGHLAGYNAIKEVIKATFNASVKYISIYAFSTENWKRASNEVGHLMKLAHKLAVSDLKELTDNEIKVLFLGSRNGLSDQMIRDIDKTEAKTEHFTRGTVAVCFNYGGQQEIADAARRCLEDGLKPEEINEDAIAKRLYAPDIPPVDMVVRTSGEQRLSNFMLWRAAYSEFMFLDKYWPDMTETDVADIIEEYNRRTRRFGK